MKKYKATKDQENSLNYAHRLPDQLLTYLTKIKWKDLKSSPKKEKKNQTCNYVRRWILSKVLQ